MTDLLTEPECRQLLRALLRGTPTGVTERDCETLLDWAREAKIAQALLTMTLSGDALPMVEGGEVKFRLANIEDK